MTFDSIRRIGISLFASAGVAGIIIGFAAQKVIASILAGFQIALTQPIRIDDVVIVEKEWGWIEEITLTYVVVRIWDKTQIDPAKHLFHRNTFPELDPRIRRYPWNSFHLYGLHGSG